jgi:hypothetical protein
LADILRFVVAIFPIFYHRVHAYWALVYLGLETAIIQFVHLLKIQLT